MEGTMNTRHAHQNYPVHVAGRHALSQSQARRRRLLGTLLIVVGSTWFWLRLNGWVGDLPMLIDLVEGTVLMLGCFDAGDVALAVPQAACGMLLPYTIRRVR
jgi:hypothetical protein